MDSHCAWLAGPSSLSFEVPPRKAWEGEPQVPPGEVGSPEATAHPACALPQHGDEWPAQGPQPRCAGRSPPADTMWPPRPWGSWAPPCRLRMLRALRCPGPAFPAEDEGGGWGSGVGGRGEQGLAPPRVCFLHWKSRALRYLCNHLERNLGAHVGGQSSRHGPHGPLSGVWGREWGADPHRPWSWDPTEETPQDPGRAP